MIQRCLPKIQKSLLNSLSAALKVNNVLQTLDQMVYRLLKGNSSERIY